MKHYEIVDNKFIIHDYLNAKKFSSFLPAIAGEDGKPMWVFYANEGQCVASFGVDSKEHPLLPFDSALMAYQNLSLKGFRTIIYFDKKIIQPFIDSGKTELIIERSKIAISWENKYFKVNILYSTISRQSYPGLIRRVEIIAKTHKKYSVIDGLPIYLPKGLSNYMYKNLTTLASAYCETIFDKYPFYYYSNRSDDDSRVVQSYDGSGFGSFCKNSSVTPKYIFDKNIVFKNESLTAINSLSNLNNSFNKQSKNSIGSAMCLYENCGDNIDFTSVFLTADSKEQFLSIMEDLDFSKLESFIECTERVVESILPQIQTSNNVLNNYIKQSFLDNYLRGGYCLMKNDKPFYVYSRKHGDLERDYNDFIIPSTYFSSGLGNYRDINQNRRNDLLFEPRIKDYNLYLFMSLIENNGFNPLIVDVSITNKNYSSFEDAIDDISNININEIRANYSTGYWIDHWVYNIDLLENYLSIYPDKINEFLSIKKYRFFDSGVDIKPRSERYVSTDRGVRQYNSLLINKNITSNWLMNNGQIIEVNLISKLFDLTIKKFATLDVDQMGLEMLADKPSWNDACNGLPGLFGSSINESIELLRLVNILANLISNTNCEISLTEASFDLYRNLLTLKGDGFDYWDKQNQYFEIFNKEYRSKTKLINVINPLTFLKKAKKILENGIKKANSIANIIPTYFIHGVDDYDVKNDRIYVKSFKTIALPPFLEGPARLLKLGTRFVSKKDVKNVCKSPLYDEKFKIFKTSVPLENVNNEIGRIKSFAPGWLERESDFLHMTFKYLLGLLKAGYFKEFFKLAKTNIPCFMKPEIYGRSIFENVSFIVPSNYPDESKEGTGNYARLTGANTEVINMYQLIFFGENIFIKDVKGVKLSISCHIPSSLFDKGLIKATLLGMDVLIKNPNNRDYDEQNELLFKIDGDDVVYLSDDLLDDIRNKKNKHTLEIFIV